MEWNREKCLQLIDIYEQYPVLWNPKHGFYYNKLKKHDAWVSICEKMECSSQEVKKKVDSLLASFRREKAKGKKSIGTGKGRQEIYLSTWFAFPRMLFLLDRDEPTQTINSYTKYGTEVDTIDESSETVTSVDDESISINDTLEEAVPESQTKNPKGKTTRSSTIQRRVKPTLPGEGKIDEAFDLLKSVVVQQKPDEISDACSDYGKHVANKLRHYSERAKAVVQYQINNILFRADMAHFDGNRNPATMTYCPDNRNSSATVLTSTPTTPIPTPSPQETMQSGMSYHDLSSPLSDINCLEPSTSTDNAASFLKNWDNNQWDTT